MKREIKFRAWHKGYNRMSPEFKIGVTKIFYLKSKLNSSPFDSDIEIMQSTGLKDKNGKEIYEGDILISEGYFDAYEEGGRDLMGVIEYSDGAYWIAKDKDTIPMLVFSENLDQKNNLEVIGNIYENPELL